MTYKEKLEKRLYNIEMIKKEYKKNYRALEEERIRIEKALKVK